MDWRLKLPNSEKPNVPAPRRLSMTDRLNLATTGPADEPTGLLEAIAQRAEAPPAADNMAEPWKDLNFKVTPEFHHRFKRTAVMHNMSMKDLLVEAFDDWLIKKSRKG